MTAPKSITLNSVSGPDHPTPIEREERMKKRTYQTGLRMSGRDSPGGIVVSSYRTLRAVAFVPHDEAARVLLAYVRSKKRSERKAYRP